MTEKPAPAPEPGRDLLRRIRLGFLLQDTTYHEWCRQRRVLPSTARQAILGSMNGPKGRKLRGQIARDAKIEAVP